MAQDDHLSFSQIKAVVTCPRKWFYYNEGVPTFRTGGLIFGTAVHAAVAEYYRLAMRGISGKAAMSQVFAALNASLREQFEHPTARLEPDEAIEDFFLSGAGLVSRYVEEIGDWFEPTAVEQSFRREINGVPVVGYIDLMGTYEDETVIVDLKTSSRTQRTIGPEDRTQLAVYALLSMDEETAGVPNTTVSAHIHSLNKSKGEVEVLRTVLTPEDFRYAGNLVRSAARVIMAGDFHPNRFAKYCSKKLCPYAALCEEDCGGVVPD